LHLQEDAVLFTLHSTHFQASASTPSGACGHNRTQPSGVCEVWAQYRHSFFVCVGLYDAGNVPALFLLIFLDVFSVFPLPQKSGASSPGARAPTFTPK
jgi:hypothetical protein